MGKFIQRAGTTTEERIYLGGWELYRKRVGTAQDIEIERETLHVMDDTRRIAMVETLTIEDEDPVSPIVPRIRYQYGNHLDSAMLECDGDGDVISYEEYHPYGTAAYRSAKSGVEVSEKRYRYTGKERDEETGFTYHQWRYYAPWLGRWTTSDPAGIVDGPNCYQYALSSPICHIDPSGTEGIASLFSWQGFGQSVAKAVEDAKTAVKDFARDTVVTALNEFSRAQAQAKAAHNEEPADVASVFGADSIRDYREKTAERFREVAAAIPPPPDTPGGKVGKALAVVAPIGMTVAPMLRPRSSQTGSPGQRPKGTGPAASEKSATKAAPTGAPKSTPTVPAPVAKAKEGASPAPGAGDARPKAAVGIPSGAPKPAPGDGPAVPGTVSQLLYGARVGEGLPGAAGVKISGRPSIVEMENLSAKHRVEFAVTYKLGPGKGGRGGTYYLHSGDVSSVEIPIEKDRIFVYHTHPGGTPRASTGDMKVLELLEEAGSPQRSSVVIPVGAGTGVRFDKDHPRR